MISLAMSVKNHSDTKIEIAMPIWRQDTQEFLISVLLAWRIVAIVIMLVLMNQLTSRT